MALTSQSHRRIKSNSESMLIRMEWMVTWWKYSNVQVVAGLFAHLNLQNYSLVKMTPPAIQISKKNSNLTDVNTTSKNQAQFHLFKCLWDQSDSFWQWLLNVWKLTHTILFKDLRSLLPHNLPHSYSDCNIPDVFSLCIPQFRPTNVRVVLVCGQQVLLPR